MLIKFLNVTSRKHYGCEEEGKFVQGRVLKQKISRLLKHDLKTMFNWWSSLGPQAGQSGENVGEKPAEGEQKTNVESCSGDAGEDKTDTQQNKTSQDSKTPELDYAKDMAKNVGSKYFGLKYVP